MPLLPEASVAYAGTFYAPREAGHERSGGCKGLQQEMKATGQPAILYRPALHSLYEAIDGPSHQRLLLSGPGGTGKSIALAGLVERVRQQGWLVLYVPTCLALVRGGYFSQRGGKNKSGLWDTPTTAQQLLKGLVDAHGPTLKRLPLRNKEELAAAARGAEDAAKAAKEALGSSRSSRTLYDFVTAAMAKDDDDALPVDTALQIVRQLAAAATLGAVDGSPVKVLIALDDYNYLYGSTDYGSHPLAPASGEASGGGDGPRPVGGRVHRRTLHSNNLALARGLRLLDFPALGAARVVAATTSSPALPTPPSLAPRQPFTELCMAPYTEDETRAALAHYHVTGHTSTLATARQARQLHALTQGNAAHLRDVASSLGIELKWSAYGGAR